MPHIHHAALLSMGKVFLTGQNFKMICLMYIDKIWFTSAVILYFLLIEDFLHEYVFLYYDLLAKTFNQKLVDKHLSF